MYSVNIGYEPNCSVVGNITGNTVKEVRKNFTEWKVTNGIAKNNGDYFLCW